MGTNQMMTISGSSIEIGNLPFSVHRKDESGKLSLFARKGINITQAIKDEIRKSNATFYINPKDLSTYVEYKVEMAKNIVNNDSAPVEKRQAVVKDLGKSIQQKISREGFDKACASHSKDFTDSVVNMVVKAPSSYSGLLNISSMDSYQYDHAVNCSTFAIMMGMEIYGRSEKKLFLLGLGSMLMDIGMNKVDRSILNKSSELSAQERKAVQLHTKYGYDMLRGHDLPPYVADMALHHHERLDGSGYPSRKNGEDIRMYLRICAAADVYDALTSRRPYRGPQLHMKAIEYMLASKNKFSLEVLQALMRIVLKNDKLINSLMAKYA